jgi:NAD(P)-dependent dehydrogenase (short-subunit alcohol dehydrogenase family)
MDRNLAHSPWSHYLFQVKNFISFFQAAMNHFTKIFGSEEAKNGIIAVAFCPGWVQTDMGGQSAHLSVDESVGELIKTISNLKIEDSGRYIDRFGKTIPY